jgi:hypothetical protein
MIGRLKSFSRKQTWKQHHQFYTKQQLYEKVFYFNNFHETFLGDYPLKASQNEFVSNYPVIYLVVFKLRLFLSVLTQCLCLTDLFDTKHFYQIQPN